jgi:hypothetical protein
VRLNYLSYLLRIWQTSGKPPTWVASLEDPHTHEVTQFTSLEALLPFLLQVIESKRSAQTKQDSNEAAGLTRRQDPGGKF